MHQMQSLLLGAMARRGSAWQSGTQKASPTSGVFAVLIADNLSDIIRAEIQNLFYVV